MPVARLRLVVPVRVELPVIYQAYSRSTFGSSDANEPGHPDQEEEEPGPSRDPGDDDPQIAGSG